MGTAGEIVIWMVLAALVGFATGWALRSVVANRARARLSDRLEDKRREAQELREELRHLRGDDEDIVRVPGAMAGPVPDWQDGDEQEEDFSEPSLSATAEHDEVAHDVEHEVELGPLDEVEHEVELGPLDEPVADADADAGGSTRAMRLDEVQWEHVDEDVEKPPSRPTDEA